MMETVSNDDTNPWHWMQPHDVARMGAVIMEPAEQQRWCRAVMLGGLPYMWRVKAKTVREMAYDRLALRPGDNVLIIGESVASCGFVDDIRDRIGPSGEIRVIDITDEGARRVLRRSTRPKWSARRLAIYVHGGDSRSVLRLRRRASSRSALRRLDRDGCRPAAHHEARAQPGPG